MSAIPTRWRCGFAWAKLAAALFLILPFAASTALVRADTAVAPDKAEADANEKYELLSRSIRQQLVEHEQLWRRQLGERYAPMGSEGRKGESWSELAVRLFDKHGWVFVDVMMRVTGSTDGERVAAWTEQDPKRIQGELAAMEAIDADPDGAFFVLTHAGRQFAQYAPQMCEALGRPFGADALARIMYPAVLARLHARSVGDYDSQDAIHLASLAGGDELASSGAPASVSDQDGIARLERDLLVLQESGDPELDRDDRIVLSAATNALTLCFTRVLTEPEARQQWLMDLDEFPGLSVLLAMVGVTLPGEATQSDDRIVSRLQKWCAILRNEPVWLDCNDLGLELGLNAHQAVALRTIEDMASPVDRWEMLRSSAGLGSSLFFVLGHEELWRAFLELRSEVPADGGLEWLCGFFASNATDFLSQNRLAPDRIARLKEVIRQAKENENVSGTTKQTLPDLEALLSPKLRELIVDSATTPAESRRYMERLGQIKDALDESSASAINWTNVLQLLGICAGRTYMADVLQEMAVDLLQASEDVRRKQQALIRGLAAVVALEKLKVRYGEQHAEKVATLLNQSESMLKHAQTEREREVAAYFISSTLFDAASFANPDYAALEKAYGNYKRLEMGYDSFQVSWANGQGNLEQKGDQSWTKYLPGYDILKVAELLAAGVTPDSEELLWAAVDAVSFIPMGGAVLKGAGAAAKGGLAFAKSSARQIGEAALQGAVAYGRFGGFRGLAREGFHAGKSLIANGRNALVAMRREAARKVSQRLAKSGTKAGTRSSRRAAGVLVKTGRGSAGDTAAVLLRNGGGDLAPAVRRSGGGVLRTFLAETVRPWAQNTTIVMLRAAVNATGRTLKWVGRIAAPFVAVSVLKLTGKNLLDLGALIGDVAGLVGELGSATREAIETLLREGVDAVMSLLGLDVNLPSWVSQVASWIVWGLLAVFVFSLVLGLAGASSAARKTRRAPWAIVRLALKILGAVGWALAGAVGWCFGMIQIRKKRKEANGEGDVAPPKRTVSVLLLGNSGAGKTSSLAALRVQATHNDSSGLMVSYEHPKFRQEIQEAVSLIFSQRKPEWPPSTKEEAGLLRTRLHHKSGDWDLDIHDVAGDTTWAFGHTVAQDEVPPNRDEGNDGFEKAADEADVLWLVLRGENVLAEMALNSEAASEGPAHGDGSPTATAVSVKQWAQALRRLLQRYSAAHRPALVVSVSQADLLADQMDRTLAWVQSEFNSFEVEAEVLATQTVEKLVDGMPAPDAKPGRGIWELQDHLVRSAERALGVRRAARRLTLVTACTSIVILAAFCVLAAYASPIVAEQTGARDEQKAEQEGTLREATNRFELFYAGGNETTSLRRVLGTSLLGQQLVEREWLPSLQPQVDELLLRVDAARKEALNDLSVGPAGYSGPLPQYIMYGSTTAKTPNPAEDLARQVERASPYEALTLVDSFCAESAGLTDSERKTLQDGLVKAFKHAQLRAQRSIDRTGRFGDWAKNAATYRRRGAPDLAYLPLLRSISELDDVDVSEDACRAVAESADGLLKIINEAQVAFVFSTSGLHSKDPAAGSEAPWGSKVSAEWAALVEYQRDLAAAARIMYSEKQRRQYLRARAEWLSFNSQWSKQNQLPPGSPKVEQLFVSLSVSLQIVAEYQELGDPDFSKATEERCKEMNRWLKDAKSKIGREFNIALTGWKIGNWSGPWGQAGDDGDDEGYLAIGLAWGNPDSQRKVPHWTDSEIGKIGSKDGWSVWYCTPQGRLTQEILPSADGTVTCLTPRIAGSLFRPFEQMDVVIEHDESNRMGFQDFDDGISRYDARGYIADFGDFYARFGWGLTSSERDGLAVGKNCFVGEIDVINEGTNDEKSWIWVISDLPPPPLPRGKKYSQDGKDVRSWLPSYEQLGHRFK